MGKYQQMENTNYDIIIVGAGAAGLMAAVRASQTAQKILIIEKMEKSAKKLRITGKGRCNLTNVAPIVDYIRLCHRGKFLRQAFNNFFHSQLMDFFNEQGLSLVTERGGRVFPASHQAIDVLNCLINYLKKKQVIFLLNSAVEKLLSDQGLIKGVRTSQGDNYYAPKVIVSAGGASYPRTGSTGDGYVLASALGHQIIDISPALVPLIVDLPSEVAPDSLLLKNVTIHVEGIKKQKMEVGDIQWYPQMLAGPLVIKQSELVYKQLRDCGSCHIIIDYKPGITREELDKRLLADITRGKKISDILGKYLPIAIHKLILHATQIPAHLPCAQVNKLQRKQLLNFLKNHRLAIKSCCPIDMAIITAGGISTNEINPRSMESKLIKGLFFGGEVIDVHAPTGGYNLQIAFSTGWLAGGSD